MLIRLILACSLALLARQVAAEAVQLQDHNGTYTVPVSINGHVIIPFIVDSGASEVAIPADVFQTLLRTGTVTNDDLIGTGKYVMADGSTGSSEQFELRELKVGNHVIHDVVANVLPFKGTPLLGQSFLSKLPSWTVDNTQHALVIGESAAPSSQNRGLSTANRTLPLSEQSQATHRTATRLTWVPLLMLYAAPYNSIDWHGPWTRNSVLAPEDFFFPSKIACAKDTERRIAKLNEDMKAPILYQCVPFQESLP
jgi:clan AA aspartic protease (TIGR02281 family)